MEPVLLTKKNAHRVTMVRRKDDPQSTPVPFNWRGQRRFGIGNFDHLIGEGDISRVIKATEFGQWEVVATSHPGYLENLWDAACQAHYWSSQNPNIIGEDELTLYERELHEDLTSMPEEQREQYLTNYKNHLSGVWSSESRVASAFVTGRSGFNYRRNEKAENAYRNKYEAFREWRERALKAVEKCKEAIKSPEEKMEKEWKNVEARINSTAATIVGIDTGVERGYNRSLFVSNLFGRIATHANNGNVEIVDKAIALVRQWNGKVKKPIITERHSFFKLPEVARNVLKQQEERANHKNKEVTFDGGKVVWNYEEDRLQLFFNNKPDDEFRQRMHRQFRFNWSRRNMAWQRQLTVNAVRAAECLLNINLQTA